MTAPAASTPKWRVSDEELGQFETRARDYKWGARADVMLPAGFIGDLRDARALIAERDAEIARLQIWGKENAEKCNRNLAKLKRMTAQRDEFVQDAITTRAAGIAEGLERAAKIVDTEEELDGDPPFVMTAESLSVARAVVRATKKSISLRIRAAIAAASKGGDDV